MSDDEKVIARQGKGVMKTRFELLLWVDNYDYLQRLAQAEGLSMAAMVNRILLRLRRGTQQNVPQSTFRTE